MVVENVTHKLQKDYGSSFESIRWVLSKIQCDSSLGGEEEDMCISTMNGGLGAHETMWKARYKRYETATFYPGDFWLFRDEIWYNIGLEGEEEDMRTFTRNEAQEVYRTV